MKKKIILGIVIVVIIFGVIGALTGDSKTTPTTTSELTKTDIQANSQQPSQTEEANANYKIGDAVKRGDTALTVNQMEEGWKSSNQFDKPQNPGDEFIVVNITLQNQSSKDLNLSGFWDFKLEDGNGVQQNEAIAAGIGLNRLTTRAGTTLTPGGKITGDLLFAVPKEATGKLVLLYKPLISFGNPARINLK